MKDRRAPEDAARRDRDGASAEPAAIPAASPLLRPSATEAAARRRLLELFERRPIPADFILENLELFMRPQRISEILALEKLYLKILDVQGAVMEFGVRWGRHLAVFIALRALHEPYNFNRRILGFDTFTGFGGASPEDGTSPRVHAGGMAVTEGYEQYLEAVLALHEAEAPLSHIRRFELCKGDAPEELAKYLDRRPATVVALAYFDMDVFAPTKDCLELLLPYLTRGTVLAFDELLHPDFPGETLALKEVLDLTEYRLQRLPTSPYPSFIVM